MFYFLLRRSLQGIVVVLGVTLVVFVIMRIVPGDPAQVLIGGNAPKEAVEELRTELGVDQPISTQFFQYLGQLAKGDLGKSFFRGTDGSSSGGTNPGSEAIKDVFAGKATVMQLILERLPLTLFLTTFALFVAMIIAIPLGFMAAVRENTWWSRIATSITLTVQSIPNFWLGVLVILIFTIKLNLISSMGYKGPGYVILPGITLGLSLVPVLMKNMTIATKGVLKRNFVKTMAARGIPEKRILLRHVAKNSSIPIITLLGVQMGMLIGSAVVIEFIFNYPGLGLLTIHSVLQRDLPVIQGIVVFIATIFVLLNILIDAIYAFIDPRIR